MVDIKEIRDKVLSGKIKQEDLDVDTQMKIVELYRREILDIRDKINKVKEETKMYKDRTAEFKKVTDMLNSEE